MIDSENNFKAIFYQDQYMKKNIWKIPWNLACRCNLQVVRVKTATVSLAFHWRRRIKQNSCSVYSSWRIKINCWKHCKRFPVAQQIMDWDKGYNVRQRFCGERQMFYQWISLDMSWFTNESPLILLIKYARLMQFFLESFTSLGVIRNDRNHHHLMTLSWKEIALPCAAKKDGTEYLEQLTP